MRGITKIRVVDSVQFFLINIGVPYFSVGVTRAEKSAANIPQILWDVFSLCIPSKKAISVLVFVVSLCLNGARIKKRIDVCIASRHYATYYIE